MSSLHFSDNAMTSPLILVDSVCRSLVPIFVGCARAVGRTTPESNPAFPLLFQSQLKYKMARGKASKDKKALTTNNLDLTTHFFSVVRYIQPSSLPSNLFSYMGIFVPFVIMLLGWLLFIRSFWCVHRQTWQREIHHEWNSNPRYIQFGLLLLDFISIFITSAKLKL